MAKEDELEAAGPELEELYAASPDEFVRRRDALAKRLRAEGEREHAAQVKALRKPSTPAWAINHAVRSKRSAARKLLAAADALADAQEEALRAGSSDELRAAMPRFGDAVEELVALVRDADADPKLNVAMLNRVRDTLRAVPGDAELRAEMEAGRVSQERKPVGIGGTMATAATRSGGQVGGTGRRRKRGGRAPGATRVREADAAERRAEKAASAAAKRAEQARRRAERAREALDAAEGKLTEAEEEERSSEAELKRARAARADLA